MKWISVKEKLPNWNDMACPSDFVLVYSENKDLFSIGNYGEGYGWDVWNNIGGNSCWGYVENNFKNEDVTHWMIIPMEGLYRFKSDGEHHGMD